MGLYSPHHGGVLYMQRFDYAARDYSHVPGYSDGLGIDWDWWKGVLAHEITHHYVDPNFPQPPYTISSEARSYWVEFE